MDVIIYHNPDCGTSRNTLAMIRNAGIEPHVIEYLKTPPTRLLLRQLIDRMGVPVRDVIREKGTPYKELGLDDPDLTDDQLLDAMMAHPILINRPIVVTPKGVRLCRPSEEVLGSPAAAAGRVRQGRRRARGRRARAAGGQRVTDTFAPAKRLAAEALGTGLLVATVVGSGIMADKLAGGNVALALLGNTIPTGAILVVLILGLGPISGAHFNPAVSLVMGLNRALPWPRGRLLHAGPDHRRLSRHAGRPWHVRPAVASARCDRPDRAGAMVCRVRRHLRAARHHPGGRALPDRGNSLCGRPVHHGSLLVHRLDLVRQSGRDDCPCADEQHSRGSRRPTCPCSSSRRSSAPLRAMALMQVAAESCTDPIEIRSHGW